MFVIEKLNTQSALSGLVGATSLSFFFTEKI